MTLKRSLAIAVTALLSAALGCSLPGQPGLIPDSTAAFAAALTQAVGTAQAQASLPPAGGQPSNAPTGAPTELAASPTTAALPTSAPTNAPTETPGAAGCNDNAKFIADITIPDGTQFLPSASFTKTWRVQNTGTCSWNSTYTLRFVGGAQMGGPAAVAFPGPVAPGVTMDISVNLTAPAAPGGYTGQWRLTNAVGSGFGTNGNPLTVVIVVPAPTATFTNTAPPPPPTSTATSTSTPTATATSTATPTNTSAPAAPTTITLNASSSGGVYSPPATVFGAPNAGDDDANRSRQAFATFSLAGIPSGATITAVRLDVSPFDQLGDPFTLGCLRGYQQNYGTLDASDFFTGSALGALWRFCSAAELTDPAAQAMDSSGISVFQSALPSGQFQIRLQFNQTATNNNNTADLLRTTPRLIVTYVGP